MITQQHRLISILLTVLKQADELRSVENIFLFTGVSCPGGRTSKDDATSPILKIKAIPNAVNNEGKMTGIKIEVVILSFPAPAITAASTISFDTCLNAETIILYEYAKYLPDSAITTIIEEPYMKFK